MKHRTAYDLALCFVLALAPVPVAATQLSDIEHIIVIYLENHSFDNLFGLFPGADGLAAAGATKIQVDKNGRPYDFLPPVIDHPYGAPPHIKPRFPTQLPNQPFNIEAYVPMGEKTGDPLHRFYEEQLQINGGRMDKFAAYSTVGGLVMGFYDGSKTRLWQYAQEFTLADHFFHAAFGGSLLNHFWLVCACTPRFPNAPAELTAMLDASGQVVHYPNTQDLVTPDGYAVNTIQPFYTPHDRAFPDNQRLPPQDMPTIGDRLTGKASWAWYAGGWKDALEGHPAASFQFHHQPFAYFKNYGDDTQARKDHLKDGQEFIDAIKSGDLPQVSFYKPIGDLTEHPGYANVLEGDTHVGEILDLIRSNPKIWNRAIIIVAFDEHGGFWDHVPPPQIDRWGPGVRVPAVIISPFAKKGFIDHTTYDTTSILRLIEKRFGLSSLGSRDEHANDLTNALDFSH
jgi:acid phosphatase